RPVDGLALVRADRGVLAGDQQLGPQVLLRNVELRYRAGLVQELAFAGVGHHLAAEHRADPAREVLEEQSMPGTDDLIVHRGGRRRRQRSTSQGQRHQISRGFPYGGESALPPFVARQRLRCGRRVTAPSREVRSYPATRPRPGKPAGAEPGAASAPPPVTPEAVTSLTRWGRHRAAPPRRPRRPPRPSRPARRPGLDAARPRRGPAALRGRPVSREGSRACRPLPTARRPPRSPLLRAPPPDDRWGCPGRVSGRSRVPLRP